MFLPQCVSTDLLINYEVLAHGSFDLHFPTAEEGERLLTGLTDTFLASLPGF